jgi:Ca2+-binding RTX toxin-like protein
LGDGALNLVLLGQFSTDGIGNAADNILSGSAGDNQLIGLAGRDTLFGGDGSDTMKGSGGSDELHGGAGNDTAFGGWGHDQIFADAGDDLIKAGKARDVLHGGAGADTLLGGVGDDTFVFENGFGSDVIIGFHAGADDIDLLDFSALGIGFGDLSVVAQAGSSLIVTPGGDSVLLTDVLPSELDGLYDFLF